MCRRWPTAPPSMTAPGLAAKGMTLNNGVLLTLEDAHALAPLLDLSQDLREHVALLSLCAEGCNMIRRNTLRTALALAQPHDGTRAFSVGTSTHATIDILFHLLDPNAAGSITFDAFSALLLA